MDNITHSLIGVILGFAILRKVPESTKLKYPSLTSWVMWTSVLANNAPDCDVVFPFFMQGGRLNSLLEHRGFTHTVVAAPILSLLCVGIVAIANSAYQRLLKNKLQLGLESTSDPSNKLEVENVERFGNVDASEKSTYARLKVWFWLWGLGNLGVLCHLIADYCNDYGIHPFWPLSNRWFYGDFIFIVEPLVWFAILPLIYFQSRLRIFKNLAIGLEVLLIGLLFFGSFVSLKVGVGAVGFSLIAWIWQWRRPRSLFPSTAMLGIVLALFFFCSKRVETEVLDFMASTASGERIVQLSRSPEPADPFCWRTIAVTEGPGDRYTLRTATVSLLPEWIKADDCSFRAGQANQTHLAPLKTVDLPTPEADDFQLVWHGEFSRTLSERNRMSQLFCQFQGLRQFARAPFWLEVPSDQPVSKNSDSMALTPPEVSQKSGFGKSAKLRAEQMSVKSSSKISELALSAAAVSVAVVSVAAVSSASQSSQFPHPHSNWIAGDLRYDRGYGFATLELGSEKAPVDCTEFFPGWEYPVP